MKEAFGGLEFGLTEICFPFPGLEHKLKVIFEAALLHYIGWELMTYQAFETANRIRS